MSTAFTQDTRRIGLETPLGKDVLLLDSFLGREEMSRLFAYDLQLLSEKDGLDAKDIVGKNVTFHIELADGSKRFFNGFVNRFAFQEHVVVNSESREVAVLDAEDNAVGRFRQAA